MLFWKETNLLYEAPLLWRFSLHESYSLAALEGPSLPDWQRLYSTLNSRMKVAYHNEFELISGAITDIYPRLERLYDAIETGKLSLDDVVFRLRNLHQRQEQLQAKRIEIES